MMVVSCLANSNLGHFKAVLGGSVFLEFWLVVVCGVVVVGGFGVVWVGWFLLGLVGVDGGGV